MKWIPIVLGGGLIVYLLTRASSTTMTEIKSSEVAPASSNERVPRHPFVSAKTELLNPSNWKINDPGLLRSGQFNLPRRDYLKTMGGSRVITYGDAWVNV